MNMKHWEWRELKVITFGTDQFVSTLKCITYPLRDWKSDTGICLHLENATTCLKLNKCLILGEKWWQKQETIQHCRSKLN